MLSERERDRLSIVLVRTRNPLNLGAAARAMSNFGFHCLRVVEPYELAFRQARSAVGARRLLESAQQYPTIGAAVSDSSLIIGTTAIGRRKLEQPLEALASGAHLIRGHLRSDRVAILFGSEKTGLSNQELSHCHSLLHIPTSAEHLAMNLGQAVAVTLYELVREGGRTAANSVDGASAGDLERLTQLVLEAATVSGFVSAPSARSSEQKLRRLIRRLNPSAHDLELLLGLLRQILWKLGDGVEH